MASRRRRYSFRDDWNRPGSRVQVAVLLSIGALTGIMAVAGARGPGLGTRLLGGLIVLLPLILGLITPRRMSR